MNHIYNDLIDKLDNYLFSLEENRITDYLDKRGR